MEIALHPVTRVVTWRLAWPPRHALGRIETGVVAMIVDADGDGGGAHRGRDDGVRPPGRARLRAMVYAVAERRPDGGPARHDAIALRARVPALLRRRLRQLLRCGPPRRTARLLRGPPR